MMLMVQDEVFTRQGGTSPLCTQGVHCVRPAPSRVRAARSNAPPFKRSNCPSVRWCGAFPLHFGGLQMVVQDLAIRGPPAASCICLVQVQFALAYCHLRLPTVVSASSATRIPHSPPPAA